MTPKAIARSKVTNALRRGDLVRPSTCSRCQRLCKPQAHHHRGYAEEFWLDVIWLCKRCHTAEHYPDRPFNPESRIEYFKEYHAKNREKRRIESAAYKAANPEQCAAAEKKWRDNNPEKVKGYWKDWSQKHGSERADYRKRYVQEHRAELNAKRRERRRKAAE